MRREEAGRRRRGRGRDAQRVAHRQGKPRGRGIVAPPPLIKEGGAILATKKARSTAAIIAAVALIAAVAVGAATVHTMRQRASEPLPAPSDLPGRTVATEEAAGYEFPVVDWEHWRSVNPDIVGWITVPGTGIDLPVAQARPSDPDFYLHHDAYGNYNVYGCAYLDADDAADGLRSRNAVICGHHMSDGSMFAALADYADPRFAQEHDTVLLQTPEERTVLKVAFVSIVNGAATAKATEFDSDAQFAQWYAAERDSALLTLPSPDATPQRVCTLVTCSYTTFKDERTLVVAYPERSVSTHAA